MQFGETKIGDEVALIERQDALERGLLASFVASTVISGREIEQQLRSAGIGRGRSPEQRRRGDKVATCQGLHALRIEGDRVLRRQRTCPSRYATFI